jgi:hypothetical protein
MERGAASRTVAQVASALESHPRVLLVLLCLVLTLGLQYWVGGATIYRTEYIAPRETLHSYIVRNQLPPGQTWMALGAHSLNIRVGAVYLAEAIHRTTRAPVYLVYKALETGFLLLAFLLFFAFIRDGVPRVYAVLALLYFAAITPLTYFLHVFHPWDRPALVTWLVCLILLRSERLLLLTLVLSLGVAIKFDIMVLPVLYFLAFARRENWRRIALRTGGMLAATFATYVALRLAFPGGFDSQRTVIEQIAKNLREFAAIPLFHPPLLALALPLLLGVVGWRSADRFKRASWGLGVALLVPLFLMTNFQELRAEMPVVVLLMPCALAGARVVLEKGRQDSTEQALA